MTGSRGARNCLWPGAAAMAMLLPVVLLVACSGAMDDVDERRVVSRAGLDAIPTRTLMPERARKLASFTSAAGGRLSVVRTRDYLYPDDRSAAAMYHEINVYMADADKRVQPGCRKSLERLARIPGAIATPRAGSGGCRFLVFHYQDTPFDTSWRRLASLYDVEDVR